MMLFFTRSYQSNPQSVEMRLSNYTQYPLFDRRDLSLLRHQRRIEVAAK